jgi:cytochrome P450
MNWQLFHLNKDEVWREGRKLLDRGLRPGATMTYRELLQDNTRGFLARLLATPNEFRHHIGLSALGHSYIVLPLTIS